MVFLIYTVGTKLITNIRGRVLRQEVGTHFVETDGAYDRSANSIESCESQGFILTRWCFLY